MPPTFVADIIKYWATIVADTRKNVGDIFRHLAEYCWLTYLMVDQSLQALEVSHTHPPSTRPRFD